jgi:hypothetical protein
MRPPRTCSATCCLFATIALPALLSARGLPAQAQAAGGVKSFANAPVETEELAEFLGITAWAFRFEGNPPRCWVEVIEENQKTVSQPKVLDVKEPNTGKEASQGKILLFLRPGNLELRLNSGAAHGGAGIALRQDALWWGWKATQGASTRLQRPIAVKPGQEVTLLRYDMEEPREAARDSRKPRRVSILLKATMAE